MMSRLSTWALTIALAAWLVLATRTGHATVVEGTVVDLAGRPVAGANIRLWNKGPSADNTSVENTPIEFDGHDDLKSDAEGRFQTPDVVDSDLPVRLVAMAEGHVASRSGWIMPGDDPVVKIDPIILVRLRGVSGRVVDRQGLPVAGVKIFHAGDAHESTSTFTDEEGRWILAGVPEGLAFVFAEKDRYWFTGQRLGSGADSVEVTLSRTDENVEPIRTHAPVLSPADELALARLLLKPYLAVVAKSGSDLDKYKAIEELVAIDPLEAFDRLEAFPFTETYPRERLQGALALRLMNRPEPDWDDIRAMIESLERHDLAVAGFINGARLMPMQMKAERLDWLNQALLRARAVQAPSERAMFLGQIVAELHGMDQHELARKLVAEVLRVAQALRAEDYVAGLAYGAAAQALAHENFESSLKWLDKLVHDVSYARVVGDMAMRFASTRPDLADQIWKLADDRIADADPAFDARNAKAQGVCYMMAGADAARAERIAEAIDDPLYRSQAFAGIASALSDRDPAGARRLLLKAAQIVVAKVTVRGAHGDGLQTEDTACAAMAGLLPVAERVDPQLGRELLWRALALREPRPQTEWLDDEVLIVDVLFAQMLARYEPSLARAIIESVTRAPVFRETPLPLIVAATVVDPRWAVELLENLPDPSDSANWRHPTNLSRLWLVRGLASQGASRWKYAGFWEPELVQ